MNSLHVRGWIVILVMLMVGSVYIRPGLLLSADMLTGNVVSLAINEVACNTGKPSFEMAVQSQPDQYALGRVLSYPRECMGGDGEALRAVYWTWPSSTYNALLDHLRFVDSVSNGGQSGEESLFSGSFQVTHVGGTNTTTFSSVAGIEAQSWLPGDVEDSDLSPVVGAFYSSQPSPGRSSGFFGSHKFISYDFIDFHEGDPNRLSWWLHINGAARMNGDDGAPFSRTYADPVFSNITGRIHVLTNVFTTMPPNQRSALELEIIGVHSRKVILMWLRDDGLAEGDSWVYWNENASSSLRYRCRWLFSAENFTRLILPIFQENVADYVAPTMPGVPLTTQISISCERKGVVKKFSYLPHEMNAMRCLRFPAVVGFALSLTPYGGDESGITMGVWGLKFRQEQGTVASFLECSEAFEWPGMRELYVSSEFFSMECAGVVEPSHKSPRCTEKASVQEPSVHIMQPSR